MRTSKIYNPVTTSSGFTNHTSYVGATNINLYEGIDGNSMTSVNTGGYWRGLGDNTHYSTYGIETRTIPAAEVSNNMTAQDVLESQPLVSHGIEVDGNTWFYFQYEPETDYTVRIGSDVEASVGATFYIDNAPFGISELAEYKANNIPENGYGFFSVNFPATERNICWVDIDYQNTTSSQEGDVTFEVTEGLPETSTFILHNFNETAINTAVLEKAGTEFDDSLRTVHCCAMLSDGRVVLAGQAEWLGPIAVNCYRAQTLDLDWTYTIPGSVLEAHSTVSVLNNGNILVTWGNNTGPLAYFAILSSTGTLVKGMTNMDTGENTVDLDQQWTVQGLPLEDGGFFCTWSPDNGYDAFSVWDADGTNREPSQVVSSGWSRSRIIQMPTASGGALAGRVAVTYQEGGYVKKISFYDPDDLTDMSYAGTVSGIDIGITTDEYEVHTAKSTLWNDRIAFVWYTAPTPVAAEMYVTIVKSDGTIAAGFNKKEILVGEKNQPTDLMALPDGNFLVLVYNSFNGSYGQDYYILDPDFDKVMGPIRSIHGIENRTSYAVWGCAGELP